VWLMLSRMAGLPCGQEVRNLMLHSGKRPDVAILCRPPTSSSLGTGAARKNGAWLSHTMPQGDDFFALCHEADGHMGDSAHDFLGMAIDSVGESASDSMAFKVYAFQRLHAANVCEVAAVINSRPAIRTGPGVPPGCGLRPPLGAARPKPAINLRNMAASSAMQIPQPQTTT